MTIFNDIANKFSKLGATQPATRIARDLEGGMKSSLRISKDKLSRYAASEGSDLQCVWRVGATRREGSTFVADVWAVARGLHVKASVVRYEEGQ